MDRALDPERWRRLSTILDGALDLPSEARARYLDQACGGDAELRREVEDLLAAEASAGPFLETPAGERSAPLVAEMVRAPGRSGGPSRGTPRRRLQVARRAGRGRHGHRPPRRARRRPVRAAGSRSSSSGTAWRAARRGAASSRSARSWPASSIPPSRACSTAASPSRACPTSSWSSWRADRSPVLRGGAARDRGAAARLPRDLRRRAVCPPQPRRPPRPQAVQHPGGPRRAREAPRLRHRQAPGRERRHDTGATRTLLQAMTPEYAAPEQVRGEP